MASMSHHRRVVTALVLLGAYFAGGPATEPTTTFVSSPGEYLPPRNTTAPAAAVFPVPVAFSVPFAVSAPFSLASDHHAGNTTTIALEQRAAVEQTVETSPLAAPIHSAILFLLLACGIHCAVITMKRFAWVRAFFARALLAMHAAGPACFLANAVFKANGDARLLVEMLPQWRHHLEPWTAHLAALLILGQFLYQYRHLGTGGAIDALCRKAVGLKHTLQEERSRRASGLAHVAALEDIAERALARGSQLELAISAQAREFQKRLDAQAQQHEKEIAREIAAYNRMASYPRRKARPEVEKMRTTEVVVLPLFEPRPARQLVEMSSEASSAKPFLAYCEDKVEEVKGPEEEGSEDEEDENKSEDEDDEEGSESESGNEEDEDDDENDDDRGNPANGSGNGNGNSSNDEPVRIASFFPNRPGGANDPKFDNILRGGASAPKSNEQTQGEIHVDIDPQKVESVATEGAIIHPTSPKCEAQVAAPRPGGTVPRSVFDFMPKKAAPSFPPSFAPPAQGYFKENKRQPLPSEFMDSSNWGALLPKAEPSSEPSFEAVLQVPCEQHSIDEKKEAQEKVDVVEEFRSLNSRIRSSLPPKSASVSNAGLKAEAQAPCAQHSSCEKEEVEESGDGIEENGVDDDSDWEDSDEDVDQSEDSDEETLSAEHRDLFEDDATDDVQQSAETDPTAEQLLPATETEMTAEDVPSPVMDTTTEIDVAQNDPNFRSTGDMTPSGMTADDMPQTEEAGFTAIDTPQTADNTSQISVTDTTTVIGVLQSDPEAHFTDDTNLFEAPLLSADPVEQNNSADYHADDTSQLEAITSTSAEATNEDDVGGNSTDQTELDAEPIAVDEVYQMNLDGQSLQGPVQTTSIAAAADVSDGDIYAAQPSAADVGSEMETDPSPPQVATLANSNSISPVQDTDQSVETESTQEMDLGTSVNASAGGVANQPVDVMDLDVQGHSQTTDEMDIETEVVVQHPVVATKNEQDSQPTDGMDFDVADQKMTDAEDQPEPGDGDHKIFDGGADVDLNCIDGTRSDEESDSEDESRDEVDSGNEDFYSHSRPDHEESDAHSDDEELSGRSKAGYYNSSSDDDEEMPEDADISRMQPRNPKLAAAVVKPMLQGLLPGLHPGSLQHTTNPTQEKIPAVNEPDKTLIEQQDPPTAYNVPSTSKFNLSFTNQALPSSAADSHNVPSASNLGTNSLDPALRDPAVNPCNTPRTSTFVSTSLDPAPRDSPVNPPARCQVSYGEDRPATETTRDVNEWFVNYKHKAQPASEAVMNSRKIALLKGQSLESPRKPLPRKQLEKVAVENMCFYKPHRDGQVFPCERTFAGPDMKKCCGDPTRYSSKGVVRGSMKRAHEDRVEASKEHLCVECHWEQEESARDLVKRLEAELEETPTNKRKDRVIEPMLPTTSSPSARKLMPITPRLRRPVNLDVLGSSAPAEVYRGDGICYSRPHREGRKYPCSRSRYQGVNGCIGDPSRYNEQGVMIRSCEASDDIKYHARELELCIECELEEDAEE